MFYLSSSGLVQSGVGPSVLQELYLPPVPLTQDWFYGEDHPRLHLSRIIVQTMVNVRGSVEEGTDPMTQEYWNNTEPLLLGIFVN